MFAATRAGRLALVFALAVVLASCTFTRFVYNQADTVAAWMVDDYFSLDGTQKDEFQKRFDRFYAWHRYEQLPEYATFLRTAKNRMQQGLARDDVLWFVDGMRARIRACGRQLAPDAAALLATVTPAQIDTLKQRWEKDNRKYAREHKLNGTPEERVQAAARRTMKQIGEWLAPLNSEQEQRVVAMMREVPDIESAFYADRLRRQKALLEILAQRGEDRARFTARVTEWLVHWERGRSAEYQRQLTAWWHKRADLFVAVHQMQTREQRVASLQRIQSYVDDFTHLARRDSGSRTASR